jgi:hypothetical protein
MASVWEEFVASETFAAAVSGAYRGRHDVRDAVWWLDHPAQQGPTGAVSPADGRDELERAAYSRAGATDPSWADALQRLDAELEADRIATREAIAEARRPVEVVVDEPDPEVVDMPTPRRWLLPAVASVIAVVIGLAVGYSLGTSRDAVVEPGYVTATNQATQQFTGIDAFAQQEEAADTPTVTLPPSFDGADFRVLNASTGGGLLPRVYAARIAGNRVCLIAVVGDDDPHTTFACAVEAEFPITGIQVGWQDGADGGVVSWDGTGGVQMSR